MGIHIIPYIFPIHWGAKELFRVSQPNVVLDTDKKLKANSWPGRFAVV